MTYTISFIFQTHPHVDKKLFNTESLIALKNQDKSFPLNSDLGVLKWRLQSTDESLIPLTSESSLFFKLKDFVWQHFHEHINHEIMHPMLSSQLTVGRQKVEVAVTSTLSMSFRTRDSNSMMLSLLFLCRKCLFKSL